MELHRLPRQVYKGGKRRHTAIIEVLANTGLRVGEMARGAMPGWRR
jgi:hypothetical protein